MSAAENILQRRVLANKDIITYRVLSRLLNCHVNDAKKHLETFRDRNKDSCHATYIVSGKVKPASLNGHAQAPYQHAEDDGMSTEEDAQVKADEAEGSAQAGRQVYEIVQEEELEACKARFDTVISCCVYSLEKNRLTDIALLVPANLTITSDAKCIKNVEASRKGATFGVIQLPPRKAGDKKKRPLPPTSPVPARLSAKDKSKDKDEKPVIKREAQIKASPNQDKGKGKAATSEELDMMDWDAAAEEEMIKMEQKTMAESQTPTPSIGGGDKMDVDATRSRKRIRKKRIVKKTIRDEKGNRRTQEVEESYSEYEGEEEPPVASTTPSSSVAGATAPAPAAEKSASGTAKKPSATAGNTQKKKVQTDDKGQTSLGSFFSKPTGGKKK